MNLYLAPALAIAFGLYWFVKHRRTARRVKDDDEFRQGAALGRRILLDGGVIEDRRSEIRQDTELSATVSVLGQSETRIDCRIINASRSGMRIAVGRQLPTDQQINVEWGNAFFVGMIRCSELKGEQQILGLSVVSTNCQ